MQTEDLTLLDQLRAVLAAREAASIDAVDTLGLLLAPKLKPSDYRQTPASCVPFAYTGGDGVHFSLAATGDKITNASPVIMTVPMHFDRPNLVVGRDLKEFLALGLRVGYFVLENLVYARDKWIKILQEQNYLEGLHPMEIETLRAIESSFDIAPWADPETNLQALEDEFGSLARPAVQ